MTTVQPVLFFMQSAIPKEDNMNFSPIALKVFAAKFTKTIKSNADFWKNYNTPEKFSNLNPSLDDAQKFISNYVKQFTDEERKSMGFICAFDKDFPVINSKASNSDKPFLLFYKGNISLLNNLNNNIAVIGLTEPTDEIEERENHILQQLVDENIVIVSGLAKGCDSIAHKFCVNNDFKTIAVLPGPIHRIAPAIHKELAEHIVQKQGLLISEYFEEPKFKREMLSRYVERDRLQAMFSKAILLIASYRKGEGDSGSRYAMESAKKYGIERYAMFNAATDNENKQFGLNKDILTDKNESVKILQKNSIPQIKKYNNSNLIRKKKIEQIQNSLI